MNLKQIEKFLTKEGKKFNKGYYNYPEVSYYNISNKDKKKLISYDKKYLKFQEEIRELFKISNNKYNKLYQLVLLAFHFNENEKAIRVALWTLNKIWVYLDNEIDHLELDHKNNRILLIKK